MAKNIEFVEDSNARLHLRQSLSSTECAIPFGSLTAGEIAEGIRDYFSIYRDLFDGHYGITGGIYEDVDEYVTLYRISGIYTIYSTVRKKDILVLKASSEARMPGTSIYDCLSSKECAGFPVYIEGKDRFIPIGGVGCNGVDLFLLVNQKEYHEPTLLFDGYMVRISRYFYKYDSRDLSLYTCNSFDIANQLLIQKYQEYKELGFES